MFLASAIAVAFAAYLGAGLLFALWFLAARVGELDHAARGSSPWFRLTILPGVAALWPWIGFRLIRRGRST